MIAENRARGVKMLQWGLRGVALCFKVTLGIFHSHRSAYLVRGKTRGVFCRILRRSQGLLVRGKTRGSLCAWEIFFSNPVDFNGGGGF